MSNRKKYIVKQNPNEGLYQEVSQAIRINNNYCCCAIEKNADTMCMCKEFRDMEEGGLCHCGRFYKVEDFPVIAILHSPEDKEKANILATGLTIQGFVVLLPFYGDSSDTFHYVSNLETYIELQKTKIHMADAVYVMNTSQQACNFLEEEILWAEELLKTIIYHCKEEKEDENREPESV